ncbi:hypothetical protein EJA70_19790 [Pseudomonas sp. PB103]|nr:hypothetical protein EJA70_19790 [Pseudomonas sp. PB103]
METTLYGDELLWRGDLSPMGRAAPPDSEYTRIGTAAQPIGDKSPHHKTPPAKEDYSHRGWSQA